MAHAQLKTAVSEDNKSLRERPVTLSSSCSEYQVKDISLNWAAQSSWRLKLYGENNTSSKTSNVFHILIQISKISENLIEVFVYITV